MRTRALKMNKIRLKTVSIAGEVAEAEAPVATAIAIVTTTKMVAAIARIAEGAVAAIVAAPQATPPMEVTSLTPKPATVKEEVVAGAAAEETTTTSSRWVAQTRRAKEARDVGVAAAVAIISSKTGVAERLEARTGAMGRTWSTRIKARAGRARRPTPPLKPTTPSSRNKCRT